MRRAALSASASERVEAFGCLADDEEEKAEGRSLSDRAIRGVRLANSSDSRAKKILEGVIKSTKDDALAAVAALHLVKAGHKEAAPVLCRLAAKQNHRFQLEASYVLEKMKCPGRRRLSFTALKDEHGRPASRLEVEHSGYLMIHPMVDGHKVANVLSAPGYFHFPFNTHATGTYICWVHGSPQWRRRGLTRIAMEATMRHPMIQTRSCIELHTGTRNVAHPLYRSCGFTDARLACHYKRPLRGEAVAPPPEGVSFRSYREGDAAAMAKLLSEVCDSWFGHGRFRTRELGPRDIAFLAHRDDELRGFVHVHAVEGDVARLGRLCLRPLQDDKKKDSDQKKDEPERIALGLLGLAHERAREEGAKYIEWYNPPEDPLILRVLGLAGYGWTRSGGVYMFGVRNLEQLLSEISTVFERRARGGDLTDWRGAILLQGQKQRGKLVLEAGKAAAALPKARPGDIILTTTDDVLSAIMLGRRTPFEAFLQTDLSIEPRVGGRLVKVLETLFPRVPMMG